MSDSLIDRLYMVLQDIEEFSELSMDRQGELCIEFAAKIENNKYSLPCGAIHCGKHPFEDCPECEEKK